MYEWLEEELVEIGTRKFHVVEGPAGSKLKRAITSSSLSAPQSYKQFVLRFGNVELYRQEGLDLYDITVFASMREATFQEEAFLWFGKNGMNRACFKVALLSGEEESPVFEWIGSGGYLRQTADGFQQWIENCHRRARKKYSKRRWKEIVRGPRPFSEEEQQIVEARKLYRWQRVGVAKNGDVEFEVHNGSDMTLPYISLGIRGAIDGGVWLPVEHIPPGKTKTVPKDCYKDVASPDEIEPFDLPDPIPEERDRYWEFRNVEHDC